MSMERLVDLLPGLNCGRCGHRSCLGFARALEDGAHPSDCPYVSPEKLAQIREIMAKRQRKRSIRGVIDGLEADFALAPLEGEPSCREELLPFDRDCELNEGDAVRYRPLGCPITHFAKILRKNHGLITVHIVGPRHLLGEPFQPSDIGICMVVAFEGVVRDGLIPEVGQTVRFLPHECMMRKVHSGVVVLSAGSRVRIESIDLKVWRP